MLAEHSNLPFFAGTAAERLVSDRSATPAIARFLASEREAVARFAAGKRTLVDVGCSTGRHLGVALELGTDYVGVDVSSRFLAEGRRRVAQLGISGERHRFVSGDAADLPSALARAGVAAAARDAVLIFGFSLLSAVDDLEGVVASLREIGTPFAATLYETTAAATDMRVEYYRRCGYDRVTIVCDERGVWLCTAGYRTVAPWRDYLLALLQRHSVSAELQPMSELGVICTSTPEPDV